MEIKGTIEVIFDTQQVTESFSKREFVVKYADNPTYPELVKMEMIQDKCDVLNDYSVGGEVVAKINIKGRKWTDPQGVDKYFNTLQCWQLGGVQKSNTNSKPEPKGIIASENEPDDLPF